MGKPACCWVMLPLAGCYKKAGRESHGEQTCKQYRSMASVSSAPDSCLSFWLQCWTVKRDKPSLCTLLLAMVFITAVKPWDTSFTSSLDLKVISDWGKPPFWWTSWEVILKFRKTKSRTRNDLKIEVLISAKCEYLEIIWAQSFYNFIPWNSDLLCLPKKELREWSTKELPASGCLLSVADLLVSSPSVGEKHGHNSHLWK